MVALDSIQLLHTYKHNNTFSDVTRRHTAFLSADRVVSVERRGSGAAVPARRGEASALSEHGFVGEVYSRNLVSLFTF